MRQHSNLQRGGMGIAILAVLGVFLALHLIFPGVTLWPAALISLVVVTMIVSHVTPNRRLSRKASDNSLIKSQ